MQRATARRLLPAYRFAPASLTLARSVKTKIGSDFSATFAGRLSYLFFYGVGSSSIFALIGLVVELLVKRQAFEG